jgi:G patch domain-containing protein 1
MHVRVPPCGFHVLRLLFPPCVLRFLSHAKQVTDEQGRRRFHGAFTGGFSAGYFNTVGACLHLLRW